MSETTFPTSLKVTPSPPAIAAKLSIPVILESAIVRVSSSAVASAAILFVTWITSIFEICGIKEDPLAEAASCIVKVSVL